MVIKSFLSILLIAKNCHPNIIDILIPNKIIINHLVENFHNCLLLLDKIILVCYFLLVQNHW